MRGGAGSRAVSIDPGQIELDAFGEILGIDRELAVIARRKGDPGRKADRGGHDEAVIVVGVLADQVDASWGAINARVTAIRASEFPFQINRLIRRAYFSCFSTFSLHKNCDRGAACFVTVFSVVLVVRNEPIINDVFHVANQESRRLWLTFAIIIQPQAIIFGTATARKQAADRWDGRLLTRGSGTNLASFDLIFGEESECLNLIKRDFLVAAFAKRPSQCPLYCRESIRSTNNRKANDRKG